MNKGWLFYVENTGLGGGRSFKRKLKINPNGCRSWYDYLQFQNRCPTHPTQKQLSQWAVWGLIPLLKWLLLWGNDKTCICHRICILGVILLNSGDHTSSELGRVIGWLPATQKTTYIIVPSTAWLLQRTNDRCTRPLLYTCTLVKFRHQHYFFRFRKTLWFRL